MSEQIVIPPGMMHCWECVYKHLRDAEHHLEDTVRVTDGKERELAELMIDTIRAIRKIVFDIYTKESVDTRSFDEVLEEGIKLLKEGRLREVSLSAKEGIANCEKIYESQAEPLSSDPVSLSCSWQREEITPKEEFDPRSFRVLCPECPEQRCSKCPPELKCATRVLIGCPKGQWDEKTQTCKVSTKVHVIEPKP